MVNGSDGSDGRALRRTEPEPDRKPRTERASDECPGDRRDEGAPPGSPSLDPECSSHDSSMREREELALPSAQNRDAGIFHTTSPERTGPWGSTFVPSIERSS